MSAALTEHVGERKLSHAFGFACDLGEQGFNSRVGVAYVGPVDAKWCPGLCSCRIYAFFHPRLFKLQNSIIML